MRRGRKATGLEKKTVVLPEDNIFGLRLFVFKIITTEGTEENPAGGKDLINR